jgi:hypothetical protein
MYPHYIVGVNPAAPQSEISTFCLPEIEKQTFLL